MSTIISILTFQRLRKLFVMFTIPPSPNVKVFLFSKTLLKKKKEKRKKRSISNFLYLGPFFLSQVIIYIYLRAAVQTYPTNNVGPR
jgi:hypothetical protein